MYMSQTYQQSPLSTILPLNFRTGIIVPYINDKNVDITISADDVLLE
jgi:hypothetical protein